MPIEAADIKFYLSGGAGNTDPDASIGGARSTTEIVAATQHNLFDIVSGAEAAAGDIKYRCFYVRNDHPDSPGLTLEAAKAFIQTNTPSTDTDVAIGLDPAGINGTAATPATENDAPAGVSFSQPSTYVGGLSIGNLAVGDFQAIWVRRTVGAGAAAYNNDGATIRVQGETAA